MQIYVSHNQQQLGPYMEAEVRAKLVEGTILPQDLVWWQGQANWLPLTQSFLAPLPGPGPLPPVPPTPIPTAAPGSSPVQLPKGEHTSTMAIGSLLLGILGLACCGYSGVGAIIAGHLSLAEIRRYPSMQGRGMALVGLVLGYVALVLFALRLFHGQIFRPMEPFWFRHI